MGNVKIGEWLSEAWSIISQDLVTHIIVALIVILGSCITFGILAGPLMGGYLWMVFQKMKDPSYTPQVGDVGKGFQMFVQLLLVAIVGGLIASLGAIACGIGALFTTALVVLALPLVVERRMAFWPAITESISKTKESLVGWGNFVLLMGLLNAVGAGLAGFGMLISLPLMVVMMAIGYRDVCGLSGAAPAAGYAAPAAVAEVPPVVQTPEIAKGSGGAFAEEAKDADDSGDHAAVASELICAECGHPLHLWPETRRKLSGMGIDVGDMTLERQGLVAVGRNDICRLLQKTSSREYALYLETCKSSAHVCRACGSVFCEECWKMMPTASEWVTYAPYTCPNCGERQGPDVVHEWPSGSGSTDTPESPTTSGSRETVRGRIPIIDGPSDPAAMAPQGIPIIETPSARYARQQQLQRQLLPRWEDVRPGMTAHEVVELLGEPDRCSDMGESFRQSLGPFAFASSGTVDSVAARHAGKQIWSWYFDEGGTFQLDFAAGKVSSVVGWTM